MKQQRGFTFVELLVVITIMSLLMAAAIVTYSGSVKSARDARRKADMETIRSALELCRAKDGSYPASVVSGSPIVCGGETVLSVVPTDPQGAAHPYGYSRSSPTVYTLTCTFEVIGNGTCSYTQP